MPACLFQQELKEEIPMRGPQVERGVGVVKEGTLIVTIDIGMISNTGYCTTINGRDTKPFKFDNTREASISSGL